MSSPHPRRSARPAALARGALAIGAAAIGALALAGPRPARADGEDRAPREEGTLSVGYGRYHLAVGVRGDEPSQAYDIDESMGFYAFEHRPARGWWWAAEGSLGIGEATPLSGSSGTVAADAYRGSLWTGALVARAGWTSHRWGAAVGPALIGHPAWGGLVVLPSADLWAGPSERLYLSLRVLAGPQSGARAMSGSLGLGSRSRWARAELNAGLTTLGGALDLHLGRGLWAGLQHQSTTALADQADPDRRTLLRITVAYDELRRTAAPEPAAPR